MVADDLQQTTCPDGPSGLFHRRGLRLTLLYFCLVAAGVFAAWQIRTFWLNRRRGEDGAVRPSRRTIPDEGQSQWEVVSPTEWFKNAFEFSGLKPLSGDPGGIAPPDNAERISAFQGERFGLLQQQAEYRYAGTLEDAVEIYRQLLRRKGFRLLRETTDTESATLLFSREMETASLRLRKRGGEYKIVNVTLVVSRLACREMPDPKEESAHGGRSTGNSE